MADTDFYQEDAEDPQDDGVDDSGLGIDDLDIDPYNPEEGLTSLQKLQKGIESENIFTRQMVARALLDTMRQVDDLEESDQLLRAMMQLSEDPEATVRTELMEQVPHVAMFAQENRHLFKDPIASTLLPIIVKYLTDCNNQVRKTSQAALLVLLEQELLQRENIEEQVCPVIMQLSHPESIDDFRTEAVALMSKMAPLVGHDLTIRQFLHRFAEMCADALFHVRKVCAVNFGDMCSVVGMENTENILLPKFFYLCEDGVWGVRKACAECFMQVAYACSLETRRNELAEVFISLICDQSRWVRMAAFQALGGFISTFADPRATGLYFGEHGGVVVGTPQEEHSPKRTREHSDSRSTPSTSEGESAVTETSGSTNDVPSVCDIPHRESEGQGSDTHVESSSGTDVQTESNRDTVDMEVDKDCQEDSAKTEEDSSQSEVISADDVNVEVSLEEQRAAVYENRDAPTEEQSNSDFSPTQYLPSVDSNSTVLGNFSVDNKDSSDVDKLKDQSSDSSEPKDIAPKDGQHPDNNNDQPKENSPPKNPAEYDSFLFWREPLPVIDLGENLTEQERVENTSSPDAPEGETTEEPREGEPPGVPSLQITDADDGEEKLVTSSDELSAYLAEADDDEKDEEEGNDDEDDDMIYTASVSTVSEPQETVTNIGSTHVLGQHVNETTMTIVDGVVQSDNPASSGLGYCPRERNSTSSRDSFCSTSSNECEQDVIPQALLDHYLSMTDPSRAQTVDTEIAKHCAYSLPAVAFTLGRKNWPCLKELYDTLAADMQWKVRRTLAFSIHELAVIVGEDVTNTDLVPVFNGFLKDLDEVRIGVLKHLNDFLKLLRPAVRTEYLQKIPEFLTTDNNRNWRFREELADQLLLLINLFSPDEISDHLLPIALSLTSDKVAEVRQSAFKVLSAILRRLNEESDQQLALVFINDIIAKFAQDSYKWSKRQMYAQLCQTVLEERSITEEKFARDMLPSLLALSADNIPNVRITVARTLSQYILCSDYFTSAQNPHHEDLLDMVKKLKTDPDRDVRFFFNNLNQTDLSDFNSIPV